MSFPAAMPYVWRELPQARARVENPGLRQPLSLIVDDPNPGYNPAYFHLGFRHGPARVPRNWSTSSPIWLCVQAYVANSASSPIPLVWGASTGRCRG